jgi:hypothetical protein
MFSGVTAYIKGIALLKTSGLKPPSVWSPLRTQSTKCSPRTSCISALKRTYIASTPDGAGDGEADAGGIEFDGLSDEEGSTLMAVSRALFGVTNVTVETN